MPNVILSLVVGLLGKAFGNKERSTEDLEISDKWNFLRETTVTSSLVMFIVYLVVGAILGGQATEVYATDRNVVVYSLMQGVLFGAGLTVLLAGVRMMFAEIIPVFKGISDKLIPDAIPALDCPILTKTVSDWIVIFGGNDFSLWTIISGVIVKIFGLGA